MSLLRLTFNNNKATGGLQLGGATAGQDCSNCPFPGPCQMLLREARERTNSSPGHLWLLLRWDTGGVAHLTLSGVLLWRPDGCVEGKHDSSEPCARHGT